MAPGGFRALRRAEREAAPRRLILELIRQADAGAGILVGGGRAGRALALPHRGLELQALGEVDLDRALGAAAAGALLGAHVDTLGDVAAGLHRGALAALARDDAEPVEPEAAAQRAERVDPPVVPVSWPTAWAISASCSGLSEAALWWNRSCDRTSSCGNGGVEERAIFGSRA